MATIFNRTKCEDCIHGQVCVKKNDFNKLVEAINNVEITVFDHGNNNAKGIVSINSDQHSAHVYIECDYFIKERDHYTPKHGGVLLCKKNTKDN